MLSTPPWFLALALLQQPSADWQAYGRDPGGSRYSPLTQITRQNVGTLAPAWSFSTGEASVVIRRGRDPALEATPLVVNGVLYLATPLGRVHALDAATGRPKWRFDAGVDPQRGYGDFASRGVSYWRAPDAPADQVCAERIFLATIDSRLFAIDATTGHPCADFGQNGSIDLRQGLRVAPFEFQAYQMTSPPAIVGNVVVAGSSIADNSNLAPASGEIRGFDARTGALRWSFDPIPQDPTDTVYLRGWRDGSARRTGGGNAWSVIVADPERDLVFVPTSSPAPDYYGGLRLGDNRYANSIVALRASTGAVVWHFQTVHHDLWDYDNASPPLLTTIRGQPAVLQATKSGMLFALDRDTGAPIFPVVERAVPRSDVPGEEAWPTQPHSLQISPAPSIKPPAWGPTPADSAWCAAALDELRWNGPFTPPGLSGTLVMPSNIGGAHWGGAAADANRGVAVVPVNTVAAMVQLIAAEGLNADSVRRADADRGISDYEYTRMRGTPYLMRRRILFGPSGAPCTRPPWGLLVAVDLSAGTIRWSVPLGAMAMGPGVPPAPTGAPNLGGPIVTASGLVFVGATLDRGFRAFDVDTGRELWHAPLPAGARATPMTYEAAGRQFVAIAAGGGGPFGRGDTLIVYALPR